MISSHLEQKVATARLGFKVVPFMIDHGSLGRGMMFMDGDGLWVEDKPNHIVWKKSWAEFDVIDAL